MLSISDVGTGVPSDKSNLLFGDGTGVPSDRSNLLPGDGTGVPSDKSNLLSVGSLIRRQVPLAANPKPQLEETNSVSNMIASDNYYYRHLPHFQPFGATYFVTFRLAGSLAASLTWRWLREATELEKIILRARTDEERAEAKELYRLKHFGRLDSMLNRSRKGPLWLRQPEIAQIVREAIEFRDGPMFDLYAFCIMPNHVHLVFKLPERDERCRGNAGGGKLVENSCSSSHPVTDIIGSLKKHTALEANRKLGRHGAFWKDESFDHVVRDGEELERILWYVILNPVKARLVKSWTDWNWTYCKAGLLW